MKPHSSKLSLAALFWLGGVFGFFLLMAAYFTGPLWPERQLLDPDGYMWLERVQELDATGHWYESRSTRSNAPWGEQLHWTRPFDMVLWAPAKIASFFCPLSDALLWWGIAVSPALLVLIFGLMARVHRLLLSTLDPSWTLFLLLASPCVLMGFAPGRPDHQSLLLVLLVANVVAGLRLFLKEEKTKPAVLLGLGCALSLWVSQETWPQIAVFACALAAAWIVEGASWARAMRLWSLALTVGVGVFLAVERPSCEWLALEVDRISFLQLGVCALGSGILAVLLRVPLSTTLRRLAGVAIAGAVLFLLIQTLCPIFLRGPAGQVDPDVERIWMSHVSEAIPLLSPKHPSSWWMVWMFVGQSLVSLAWSGRWTLREKGGMRWAWLFIFLGSALYSALALGANCRWASHAQLWSLPAWVALVAAIVHRIPGRWRVLGLLGVAVHPLFVGALAAQAPFSAPLERGHLSHENTQGPSMPSQKPRWDLSFTPLCAFLEARSFGQSSGPDRPRRILAFIDLGPEILYRTRHEVISTPYHRNTAGILDEWNILASVRDEDALALARARGLDAILVCTDFEEETAYYARAPQGCLRNRLLEGKIPAWLQAVDLPSGLAPHFKLYEVRAGAASGR